MTRKAQMADGTILEFPDNTPDAVMDRVAKQHSAQPSRAPSMGQQMGRSVVNSVAGAAQGIASIPDAVTEGIAGILRMGAAPLAKASAGMYRGLGMEGAANSVDRNAQTFDRALAAPATIGRGIEAAAPTRPGFETSRFISQLVGGMAVPFGPKAASAVPTRYPAPRAPKASPPRVPPAIAAASPEAAQVAPLGRQAALRFAQMRRAGVQNPTTAMVTREPRLWKFERETAKLPEVGDDMLSAIQGVQDDLTTASRNLVDRQGGAIGREATGARLSKALADKNDDLSQEVSALYSQVRDATGNARIPTLENLKGTYSHPDWADNAQFDDMAAAINKRLARYADADGGASGLTVNQSEELRKFIGNLGTNDRQGFAMRKVFQNALDTDVLDNFGGAPFANARAAAASRFAEFGKTLPGKVAAGDIPAERLGDRLLSAQTPLADVRQLRQSLTTGRTAEQGKVALDTLGAQVLDDMFAKGTTAGGSINGTALSKQFDQMAPRLQIILGPQRYKELRRLSQAAKYATTEVPGAAVNHSNTASTLAGMMGKDVSQAASNNLLPNFARRAAGAVTGGILGGPVAGIIGDQAAAAVNRSIASKAYQAASAKLASQIAIARNPIKAAEMLQAAANNTKADPLARQFAKRLLEQMDNAKPAAVRASLPAINRTGELLMLQSPRAVSAGEAPEDQRR